MGQLQRRTARGPASVIATVSTTAQARLAANSSNSSARAPYRSGGAVSEVHACLRRCPGGARSRLKRNQGTLANVKLTVFNNRRPPNHL